MRFGNNEKYFFYITVPVEESDDGVVVCDIDVTVGEVIGIWFSCFVVCRFEDVDVSCRIVMFSDDLPKIIAC